MDPHQPARTGTSSVLADLDRPAVTTFETKRAPVRTLSSDSVNEQVRDSIESLTCFHPSAFVECRQKAQNDVARIHRDSSDLQPVVDGAGIRP